MQLIRSATLETVLYNIKYECRITLMFTVLTYPESESEVMIFKEGHITNKILQDIRISGWLI